MELSWLATAKLAGLDIVLVLLLALFALDAAESLYRRWRMRRMDTGAG